MKNSNTTQATHSNVYNLPLSLKTQAGSPKPDIFKIEENNELAEKL